MSGLKQQKTSNLFDPVTGAYVGVIDLNGKETFVATYDPVTGAQRAGAVAINIIAKIKASIAGAAGNNNPVEQAPWNAAPAWATGTGYGYGQVTTNANNDYICVTTAGGTSGATAPTGTGPNPVSDGTLSWLYLGGHETAAVAYDAPVITYSATLTGFSRSVPTVLSGAINAPYGYTGGIPFVNTAQNFVFVAGSNPGAGGNLNGNGGIYGTAAYGMQGAVVDFMTDAPKIGLPQNNQINQGTPCAIEVNGRRVQPGSCVPGSNIGGGGNVILDFTGSAARGRQQRRIKMRFFGTGLWGGANIDPASSIWQVKNPNRYTLFIEGDSLTAGAAASGVNRGPIAAGISLADQVSSLIGCDSAIAGGVGGTGFNNNNSTLTTYLQRLPFLVAAQPDVVWICGNYNDKDFATSAARQAAIIIYLQALRTALPNAIIVVWGPWPVNLSAVTATTWPAPPAANANSLVTSDADMQIATAAAGVGAIFYSLLNDSAGSWCYGTGTTSAQTSNGNADIYVGGSDGVHPPQQGTDYMARRYANAFKQMVSAM